MPCHPNETTAQKKVLPNFPCNHHIVQLLTHTTAHKRFSILFHSDRIQHYFDAGGKCYICQNTSLHTRNFFACRSCIPQVYLSWYRGHNMQIGLRYTRFICLSFKMSNIHLWLACPNKLRKPVRNNWKGIRGKYLHQYNLIKFKEPTDKTLNRPGHDRFDSIEDQIPQLRLGLRFSVKNFGSC